MFKDIGTGKGSVKITVNGCHVDVPAQISVWGAMALAGQSLTRYSEISNQPRSAYCAMGACFECLVEIDGQANVQACLTRVRAGMEIRTQGFSDD